MTKISSIKTQRKRAFTLVELIFSIVIIAIVFTVVPKLLFVTTKTMEFSFKEDGLFAGIALMGNIIRLPWDSNTTSSQGKILDTSINVCNDYRVGGFIGSRNCIGSNSVATGKANFGTITTDYGDVDDYDGYSSSTTSSTLGRITYDLNVTVDYADKIFNASALSNEVKKVDVGVTTNSRVKLCSSFFYYSANLGHIQINKRVW